MVWSVYNAWSYTLFTFQANWELSSNEVVIYKELQAKNLPLNKHLHEEEKSNPSDVEVVFHTLLLLHCLLFFIKIIFELSLGISRFTNIGELTNLGCLFVMIMTTFTSIIIKNNIEIDFTDDTKFYNFSLLNKLEDVLNVAITICTFFFPFRIFQFLAHFSYFDPAKTVINTFVRTTPGIIVYCFLGVLMLVCWAIGIHFSLASMFMEFSTYHDTILALISSDLQMISSGFKENSIEGGVLKMTQLFITVSKICIISAAIAFITNLYKKAMIFEKGHSAMDPAKVTFRETVEEINDKITQIFKKSMNVQ